MCGIVGLIDFRKNIETGVLSEMTSSLYNRGPDDGGVCHEGNIGVGHRRLSIIDTSMAGHQPMSDESGRYTIVYNGEVYNFNEIKEELLSRGYRFRSCTDTEVVLNSFIEWGEGAVSRFRGMFAFCVWDRQIGKLSLFRDRIGAKPLYWYHDENTFMFASELKAFHKNPAFRKEIDKTGLALFLRFGYINSPHCIFKNTHKLKPGHSLSVDGSGRVETRQYWDVRTRVPYVRGGRELKEDLRERLTEAFRLRLISDVPVGVFLSGGVDSSLLLALIRDGITNIKTFTIGFRDKEYDEAEHARKIARHLGTEHFDCFCTQKEIADIAPLLPDFYDEPLGDASAISTILLSRMARTEVKVALSADGGDELFGGYKRYRLMLQMSRVLEKIPSRLRTGVLKGCLGAVVDYGILRNQRHVFRSEYLKRLLACENTADMYALYCAYNNDDFISSIMTSDAGIDYGNYSLKEISMAQMGTADLLTYVPDNLMTKVDRATMGVSLEGREPFLDHNLIEYALGLDDAVKYSKGSGKLILKELLRDYYPQELVNRPKQGFGIPGYKLVLENLKDEFLDLVTPDEMEGLGFKPEAITRIRENVKAGLPMNSISIIWFLFVLAQWKRKWRV